MCRTLAVAHRNLAQAQQCALKLQGKPAPSTSIWHVESMVHISGKLKIYFFLKDAYKNSIVDLKMYSYPTSHIVREISIFRRKLPKKYSDFLLSLKWLRRLRLILYSW